MIDNFAIALTHVMMLYVAWRITDMPQVDDETAPPESVTKKDSRWSR